MRVLWTLLKIVIALALAIPITIFVLATALGILGALMGVTVLALKLGIIGLIGWGMFRLISRILGGPKVDRMVKELPPVDPHYEAAMRELDRELGEASR